MRDRCVVISKSSNRLLEDGLAVCRAHFRKVSVFTPEYDVSDDDLNNQEWDLLISFLSERILRGDVLERPNINLHPAPPEYPGRGAGSYAIFDGAKEYGAVVHSMVASIDSGPIRAAMRFPIHPSDTCETLFAKAERHCVDLLTECLDVFDRTGSLPESPERWVGRARTRKQFLEWLQLDPSNREEFVRKVRAGMHFKFPGPYVAVHGIRFALVYDPELINLWSPCEGRRPE